MTGKSPGGLVKLADSKNASGAGTLHLGYDLTMRIIRSQILGGTRLDSQGEPLTYEDLQYFCARAGVRIPLHQKHSMGEPTLGFIENLRTVPDPEFPREWRLVGDVTVAVGSLDEALKGFSISFTRELVTRESAPLLIYLPYPHYNDQEFVRTLASDSNLSIGKWIKKQADPTVVAVFGATAVFLLKPVWDEVYKEIVSPWVKEFLRIHLSTLQQRNLRLEHVQMVMFNKQQLELRFIPEPGKEQYCFSEDLLMGGVSAAADILENEPRSRSLGVARVVLHYRSVARAYEVSRLEFNDGTVEQFV